MAAPRVHYKLYDQLDGSQARLVQQVGSGSIIRRFDRTPLPSTPSDVVCPHFLELKWAYGCCYSCAWCYLQGTLRLLPTKTKPVVKDYARIEAHLAAFFEATGQDAGALGSDYPSELLNTGELADSLMWEHNGHPFSQFVTDVFDTQTKHRVLFLSKSDGVDNLLKRDSDLLVPSFTLNSASVAKRWECGAPPPVRRIRAAASLASSGYPVRIRIDPLVPVPKWRIQYRHLLDQVFAAFAPERITLGSLRGLQSTINSARDRSWTVYLAEWSNWGRKVSFLTRKEMYACLVEYLREAFGYDRVALCKESIAMWQQLELDHKSPICNCVV
jgi:spore photoproduct lyase